MELSTYFRKIGAKGGEARKKKSTLAQRQEWGGLGGRPKKDPKKSTKKVDPAKVPETE